MKIEANGRSYVVIVDGKVLDPAPSQAVMNHSPDGFSWGYHGSGPAQLALALLLLVAPEPIALRLYQQFKRDVIANKPMSESWILDIDVEDWISSAIGSKWKEPTNAT